MEKYQPTPEEIQAAEASLAPAQREATKNREAVFNANETMTGVSGALMKMDRKKLEAGPFEEKFEGEIGGHKVTLTLHAIAHPSGPGAFQVHFESYAATVDGMEMPEEIAKKIYQKYGYRQTANEYETNRDIEAVEKERYDFQIEEIKKDLKL